MAVATQTGVRNAVEAQRAVRRIEAAEARLRICPVVDIAGGSSQGHLTRLKKYVPVDRDVFFSLGMGLVAGAQTSVLSGVLGPPRFIAALGGRTKLADITDQSPDVLGRKESC